jgi:hypothetical protein
MPLKITDILAGGTGNDGNQHDEKSFRKRQRLGSRMTLHS